jgi:FtsP/CotA-like multicopper oxidase with cupredoxin domain
MPTNKVAVASLAIAIAIPLFGSGLRAQQTNAQVTYTLKATPKTVAWGYYDAKAAPVLRIKSGDAVEIQTLITNSRSGTS